MGVAVGGTGVAVGGTGVAVGGIGVMVGSTGVGVGGISVDVSGSGVGVITGAPHPTKNNITNVTPITCCSNFWRLIFDSFRRGCPTA